MSERVARIARTTKETDIDLSVGLDGTGKTNVETGIGFFDHMLTAFGRHGLFDLQVRCKGDLEVDGHHSVEDTGIVMGQAFAQALGDKRGIRRFGDIAMPMDEALIMAAVDISGRGQLYWDADVPAVMVGAFDATLAKEFFIAFAANAGVTLHIRQLAGEQHPPCHRGHVQGGGARYAPGLRARPPHGRRAAVHEGDAIRLAAPA